MQREDLKIELELWLGQANLVLSVEEIVKKVTQEKNNFLADFAVSGGAFLNEIEEREIQEWTNSELGKKVARSIMEDINWVFEIMRKEELGAHDLRHMLLVGWTGILVLEEMDWVGDWRKWAVVSCFTHDWGRVIEAKMRQEIFARGETEFFWEDGIHSVLSFFVLDKLLEEYRGQMPDKLIDLILYAVLEHPGRPGAYETPGALSEIVQHSDRSQMINEEEMARMFSEEVAHFGYYFGMRQDAGARFEYRIAPEGFRQSVKERVEFFWRRIHLILGRNVEARERELKAESGRVIWTMCLDWQREQIFAPEFLVYERSEMSEEEYLGQVENLGWKELTAREVWEEMRVLGGDERERELILKKLENWQSWGTEKLIRAVMSATGMKTSKESKEKAVLAWRDLARENEEEAELMGVALSWVMYFREKNDQVRRQKVRELKEKFKDDYFLRAGVELVERYLVAGNNN